MNTVSVQRGMIIMPQFTRYVSYLVRRMMPKNPIYPSGVVRLLVNSSSTKYDAVKNYFLNLYRVRCSEKKKSDNNLRGEKKKYLKGVKFLIWNLFDLFLSIVVKSDAVFNPKSMTIEMTTQMYEKLSPEKKETQHLKKRNSPPEWMQGKEYHSRESDFDCMLFFLKWRES